MGSVSGKVDINDGMHVSKPQCIVGTEGVPSDSSTPSGTSSSDDHTTDGFSSRSVSHGSYDEMMLVTDKTIEKSNTKFKVAQDEPRMALPFLRTTIEQSAHSTPQKLQFYIYRDLYVTSQEMRENMEYYNTVFKELCEREMHFLTISSEISASFCRTAVTTNAVILEIGYDTYLLECMLLYHHCLLPDNIGNKLGQYLGKLNRKTNVHTRKLSHLIEGKFRSSASMEKNYEFVHNLMLNGLISCETISRQVRDALDSPPIRKQMGHLRAQLCYPSERVVVHSRFRPENICVKMQSGNILPFGSEQCVYGQPALDIGLIIGNLLVHHYINRLNRSRTDGTPPESWPAICDNIEQIIADLTDTFLDEIDVDVSLHLVAGYAGIEILYRSWPNTCADAIPIEDYMLNDLIECGQRLILASAQGKKSVRSPDQLLTIALCPTET